MTAAIVTVQRANASHSSYSGGGGGPEYEGPSGDLPESKPPVNRIVATTKVFGFISTNSGVPQFVEAKRYRGVVKERGSRRRKVGIEIKRYEEKDDDLLIDGEQITDLEQRKVLIGRNAVSRFIRRRRLSWESTGWRDEGEE